MTVDKVTEISQYSNDTIPLLVIVSHYEENILYLTILNINFYPRGVHGQAFISYQTLNVVGGHSPIMQ